MSANTIKKATALAKNGVIMIEDDLFQVKSSSDPSKSYMVTSDSCDCQGFKNFYKFHHGKGLKANRNEIGNSCISSCSRLCSECPDSIYAPRP